MVAQALHAVTTYRFEDRHPVRVKESGGMIWFVAKDVCDALDIRNHRQAVEAFDAEEKGVCLIDTPGGPQEMLVVSEPGLYRLVMRSDKPEARHFQKWVFHDVLPSIRRTGSYAVKPLSLAEQLLASAQALVRQEQELSALRGQVEYHEERIGKAMDTAEHAFRRSESNHGHFSVMGYCIRTGRHLDVQEAARHGTRLTRLCKGLGIPVAKVADPRFGKVNTDPEDILREHFGKVVSPPTLSCWPFRPSLARLASCPFGASPS
jgi:prophage antirepressor-like protein